jgi:Flp pilus assembly protein TadD
LAEFTRANGDESGAEAQLRKAMAANPKSGALAHALGLSLIRQKRVADGVVELAKAAELEPNEPRFAYVEAVALHDTGDAPRAIEVLKSLLNRRPYDRDALVALVTYEMESGDLISAASRARLLSRLEPESEDIRQLLGEIENAMKGKP